MAGFGKGGGRGNTGAQELDGTTSPTQSTKSTSKKSISSSIYFPVASCKSPSAAGVWAGLPSKPSISTKTPSGTDDDAGLTHLVRTLPRLRLWGDDWLSRGFSSGSRVTAGSGSLSGVGSGDISVQRDDGWLVTGLGVGLEMSSAGSFGLESAAADRIPARDRRLSRHRMVASFQSRLPVSGSSIGWWYVIPIWKSVRRTSPSRELVSASGTNALA